MRNHDLDAFEKNMFWRENGRGHHAGAKGSGASKPDQKFGPPDGTSGSTFITDKC